MNKTTNKLLRRQLRKTRTVAEGTVTKRFWVIADGYPTLCSTCWRNYGAGQRSEYRAVYRREDGTLGVAEGPNRAIEIPKGCKLYRLESRTVSLGKWGECE